MARLLRPNEPCWCGKGKYKRCHMADDEKKPLTPQQFLDLQRRVREDRTCLHPDAGHGCNGIISAHSIQKSGSLSLIAENNHVHTLTRDDLIVLGKVPTRPLEPKPIGINEASTFTGFCNRHDGVFAPVETVPFRGSREQVFLLGYRAVCDEIHARRYQERSMEMLKEAGRRWPAQERINLQRGILTWFEGAKQGYSRTKALKSQYDALLKSGDYSSVGGHSFLLDRAPHVMSTGTIFPEFDFQGQVIQVMHVAPATLKEIQFTLVGTSTGGAAVFQWVEPNDPARHLVKSLCSLPVDQIPHAISRFTFEHFGRTFFRPSWWKGLSDEVKESLRKRTVAGNMFNERRPRCLVDDKLRYTPWTVASQVDAASTP